MQSFMYETTAYSLIGFIVYWVAYSLGEMSAYIPVMFMLHLSLDTNESHHPELQQHAYHHTRYLVPSLSFVVVLWTNHLALWWDTIIGKTRHLLLAWCCGTLDSHLS